ncbi:MAG TPA: glycosyltransferase [Planococcus sp. (in: firmicutes)]|nr:glycosyltransferase [Planococcus sp. (in: firmicutes)]
MEDKISVIIPVYNVEDYLVKCVDSVIHQTHKNLEILLVNDGSTDGSGAICDSLEQTDSRVKVIHKENGGLSDARNAGMDAATGDFFAFLDSDDWVDRDMYEVLYKLMVEHDADLTICRFKNIYNHMVEDGSTGKVAVYDNIGALKAIAIIENNFFPTHNVWNKLYRRELVENFRFIKGKLVEDLYFTPQVVYASKRCVYIDKAMYNYLRERPTSIMNAPINFKRITDELNGYNEFAQFLAELKLPKHSLNIKEIYLRRLMELHYQVKNSKVENKDKILKTLEEDFFTSPYRISKTSMSKNIRWKIGLFELSPACSFYVRNALKGIRSIKRKDSRKPAI